MPCFATHPVFALCICVGVSLSVGIPPLHGTNPVDSNEGGLGSAEQKSCFLIGNSLTWDTVPSLMGEGVAWHVDCGKSLPYIFENPNNPCVKSSTLWTEALKSTRYDILCVQPHFGSTLDQDVQVIAKWLALQPDADLVIHTGWGRHAQFVVDYQSNHDDGRMIHTTDYFARLVKALSRRFPDRNITTTGAIEVLYQISRDIEAKQAPFEEFADIYRDDIHLQQKSGRYLVHNLMRVALGLPRSDQGFQIEPGHKEYFDAKIDQFVASRHPPERK